MRFQEELAQRCCGKIYGERTSDIEPSVGVNRRCSYANKVYDDFRSPNLLERFHHLNPANVIFRSALLIVPI
nr:hypothetical protein [uncultured Campylobacter sp.]